MKTLRQLGRPRLRDLFVFLGAIGVLMTSSVTMPEDSPKPPVSDAQYEKFFVHFVDKRSLPTPVLKALQVPDDSIGRSFALIAGVSHYPMLPEKDQELPPAAEDIRKLVRYLKDYEFFDEIVVLKDDDVTTANLAYFLQNYFPQRLQANPKSRFLFAYSGHGFITSAATSSYILTTKSKSFSDRYNSINLKNLKDYVDEAVDQGFQVLVLLNSCNSGSFLPRSYGNIPRVSDKPGAFAITAGTSEELTWAYPDVGSGSLFFEKFFAGLGGPADFAQNGLITADSLWSYIRREVQIVNHDQSPSLGDISRNGSRGTFLFFNREILIQHKIVAEWDPGVSGPVNSAQALGPAWPPNVATGGSYVVSKADATRTIPYLRLPDNFTLRFAPDVREVNWTIGVMEFGVKSTLDASAPREALVPGPAGVDAGGQPSWGVAGAPGGPGGSGAVGLDGVAVTLNVDTILPRGSLWIRSDGGDGGIGGRGGNGQLGGGSSCGIVLGSEPHTNGGRGGSGGEGGPGGVGGSTSKVQIVAKHVPRAIPASACQTECGASERPPNALADNAVIAIWGAPGCGGKGGPGGAGGGGGDEGQERQCVIVGGVHGGTPGPPGPAGRMSRQGGCVVEAH